MGNKGLGLKEGTHGREIVVVLRRVLSSCCWWGGRVIEATCALCLEQANVARTWPTALRREIWSCTSKIGQRATTRSLSPMPEVRAFQPPGGRILHTHSPTVHKARQPTKEKINTAASTIWGGSIFPPRHIICKRNGGGPDGTLSRGFLVADGG